MSNELSAKRFALTGFAAVALAVAGVATFVAAPASAGPKASPAAQAAAPAVETKDIVDTAVGAGSFNTLAKLLTAADLVSTLKGPGPFTVFAPTDAAFAKLPAEVVADLLKPENKAKLQAVLTYHVVAGRVLAADVKSGEVPTVNGAKATIKVDGGKVTIDNATVTKTDILASNGVIHVIDTVILPK